jgi:signal transduction histidine kinase
VTKGFDHMLSTAKSTGWLTLRWRRVAHHLRWITHPITIFVGLQIVWLAITLIWVIWFANIQGELAQLVQRFGRNGVFESDRTLAFLVTGCVLLGVLLVGTIMLFVFGQRQSYVARQQRTFVSSVTHELKSPLASLQLAFETMGARQLSPEQSHRMYDMINTDIERLKRLVDQILLAGRLDRGILVFDEESQAVLIEGLIDRICQQLSYLDPNVRDRLTIAAPAGLTVQAGRAALSLILGNLIENAIKYSPREAPITVSVEQGGNEMVLYVKDRGYGLEKKDLRRIFRMFHRSESAIKKAIPGTGLGLYIVRSAVRVLGGRVWVESAGRNQGSTFYVSLPVGSHYLATGPSA